MDREIKKQDYLSKARQVEQDAAKAKDDENRASLLKIAAGYRALALRG